MTITPHDHHGGNDQPLNLFWFLPTGGDGPYLGSDPGHRPADFGYLREIAAAADRLGFGGVLLPTGNNCLDGWTLGSALAPATQTLKFLLALRPGILSPALAARQSAAFDRISNGRLLLNIVTGGLPNELAGDGLLLDHDERYDQTDEFLTIWRGSLQRRHRLRRPPPDRTQCAPRLVRQCAEATSATVVRRLISRWHRGRCGARRYLSHLGRTADNGRRQTGHRAQKRRGARSHAGLRAARSSDRARDRRGSVERGRTADQPPVGRDDRVSEDASSSRPPIPLANAANSNCMEVGATSWRSALTCGPASAWCATASAPHWSAVRRPWRRACANIRHSASRR